MSSKTSNKTNKTLFTAAHNDSITIQNRLGCVSSTGSSIYSSARVISVPESIVHCKTAAVACKEEIVENPANSSYLAASVSKKAFVLAVQVENGEGSPGEQLGQGRFIRCRLTTLSGSLMPPKKWKPLDAYGPAPALAIKQSNSAVHVSVVPVTALHNVVKDFYQGEHYNVMSLPIMANNAGVVKVHEFKRRNEAYVTAAAKQISFLGANSFLWKYGFDVTTGDLIRKVTRAETNPNLSFEAVGSGFGYKIGQKIGMAVYRNYEFDFANNNIYTNNGWKKEDFPRNDIMRIFGEDLAVSIYTGEITAVSLDKEVFRCSINSFRGCSGAIVFLLDKNQDGLVEEKYWGKAIGVHVGTFEETATTTTAYWTKSQSGQEQFNIAFALAGFAEQDAYSEEE